MFCSIISACWGMIFFTWSTIIFFISSLFISILPVTFTFLASGVVKVYVFFIFMPFTPSTISVLPVLMILPFNDNGEGSAIIELMIFFSFICSMIEAFNLSFDNISEASEGNWANNSSNIVSIILLDFSTISSIFLMPVTFPSTSVITITFVPLRISVVAFIKRPTISFASASVSVFSNVLSITYPLRELSITTYRVSLFTLMVLPVTFVTTVMR